MDRPALSWLCFAHHTINTLALQAFSTVIHTHNIDTHITSPPPPAPDRFSVPLSQLQRATVYAGPYQRLRGLLAAAMAGSLPNNNTLRVGVVGGSIAWGHGKQSTEAR